MNGRKIVMAILFASLFSVSGGLLSALSPKSATEWKISSKHSLHHDPSAYTQGLFIHDGMLYESTGQYGESSLRRVDLSSGEVLKRVSFPGDYFVEGSCYLDGRIYVLTWHEECCFVYDCENMEEIGRLSYKGEGWGLTTDGKELIMSDGSSVLRFRDPLSFVETRSVTVTFNGRPVGYLNELEYINGEIWANVYGTDIIVIVDPSTGNVTGRVDCTALLDPQYRGRNVDVLNGIAYDPSSESLYLTGKYWPKLYKISVSKK